MILQSVKILVGRNGIIRPALLSVCFRNPPGGINRPWVSLVSGKEIPCRLQTSLQFMTAHIRHAVTLHHEPAGIRHQSGLFLGDFLLLDQLQQIFRIHTGILNSSGRDLSRSKMIPRLQNVFSSRWRILLLHTRCSTRTTHMPHPIRIKLLQIQTIIRNCLVDVVGLMNGPGFLVSDCILKIPTNLHG